jgi:hypothetical protein
MCGQQHQKKPTSSSSPNKKKNNTKVELSDAKIGFVGARKIAQSIIRGLMTYPKIDANRIFVAVMRISGSFFLKK